MARSLTCCAFGALTIALAACGGQASDEAAATPIANVVVEAVSPHAMVDTLEAYGTVDYAPSQLHNLDAHAEIVVQEVLVTTGQAVRAGQPLLRVGASANTALERRKAEADLAAAEQELARVRRLMPEHLATNADLSAARQGAESAGAAARSALESIPSADGAILHADRQGVIASIDVARGDIAPTGTVLIHMASDHGLNVRLGIEPEDLRRIRPDQAVTVHPVYDEATVEHGSVAQIVEHVDDKTRLAQVLVAMQDTRGLLAGTTVRATIVLGRRAQVISVPRAALLHDAAGASFLFTTDGRTAHRVAVVAGIDDGKRVEIRSGLRPGQRVVVEGNYVLSDGMRVALQSTGAAR